MNNYRLKFLVVTFTVGFNSFLHAQNDFVVPRTEWGAPDLSGVWNFSSIIPLERPAFFRDKKTLSKEEIAALTSQQEAGFDAINSIGVGGYNTFWIEMGENGDNRTSLITVSYTHLTLPTNREV